MPYMLLHYFWRWFWRNKSLILLIIIWNVNTITIKQSWGFIIYAMVISYFYLRKSECYISVHVTWSYGEIGYTFSIYLELTRTTMDKVNNCWHMQFKTSYLICIWLLNIWNKSLMKICIFSWILQNKSILHMYLISIYKIQSSE